MSAFSKGFIASQDISELAESENLILSDQDRMSVLQAMHSIDVQACPGSGKTTLIAAKLILLANKWPHSHQGVCVLSHTNVAKDEIINRLKKSKSRKAQGLLSYPHFIGTIQEFVNRFLALPYLRSKGINQVIVDNNEYIRYAQKLLDMGQFSWLKSTLKGLGDGSKVDSFLLKTYRLPNDESGVINIPSRPKAWKKDENYQKACELIGKLKGLLESRGIFLYRDMYSQADFVLSRENSLKDIMCRRFPFVFFDEMQDTQKFQDELLVRIFPLSNSEIVVQRFGDPDQAIFNGVNGEKSNLSFNEKSASEMDFIINKSHRFRGSIAERIRGFSCNEVPLQTELTKDMIEKRNLLSKSGTGFDHTIILFDDNSLNKVIPSYSRILSEQFSDEHKLSVEFTAKVVGGVGNQIDTAKEQLKIGHYWHGYDKAKDKGRYKPESLIESVMYSPSEKTMEWAYSYKLVTDYILKILRLLGRKDPSNKWYTQSSLREWLGGRGKQIEFRELVFNMLNSRGRVSKDTWGNFTRDLSLILGLDSRDNKAIVSHLAFAEWIDDSLEGDDVVELVSMPNNIISHRDGFNIELSTIHGVKGETHDATLILETKNHRNDLEVMLPFFIGDLPSEEFPNAKLRPKPHHNANPPHNKQFLRQLYVAMSRPKHLLCLAIHSSRASDECRAKLRDKGWKIIELCPRQTL